MSVEDLKEYGRRCVADPELRDRVKAIGLHDIDAQIEQARSLGLEWTQEDLQALAEEVGAGEGELSEEHLEIVAGGGPPPTIGVLAAGVVGAGVMTGAGLAASSSW